MCCLPVQFNTEAFRCLALLILDQSDVAGMTLTSQPHGADTDEGQSTQSGREHVEPRYWKTTALFVGKSPLSSTSAPSLISFLLIYFANSSQRTTASLGFSAVNNAKTTTCRLVLQWNIKY